MSIASKIINTILTGIALLSVFILIIGFMEIGKEAVASPTYSDYDNIYATIVYYFIFWGASILNIITVCCQKTKTSKKVINFVVVTIISLAMLGGIIAFIGFFEVKALEEGLDTTAYEKLMSPELTSYLFNGILIYGVITAITLLGFIISPFLFKKRIDAQTSQQQTTPQQAQRLQTAPQTAPQATPQATPQTTPQPNNSQAQSPQQTYTSESKSPFEL